jgi:predicted O-linked N-acetylglucosamine transferase (SPINDLY family)
MELLWSACRTVTARYKIEPESFRLWMRVLKRVPNSILWLIRLALSHLTRPIADQSTQLSFG